MIERIRDLFIEETTQQLSTIELLLNNPIDGNIHESVVEKVFHAMHSIKGAAPMVGFNSLPLIAAPVEKAFAKIRKGELAVSDEIIRHTNTIIRIFIDALNSKSDTGISEGHEKTELVNFFKNLSS
jgi:chemotaxis protein histidine kinase CheA